MAKYWFEHIHLNSPDPLKTAEFYKKMFGAEQTGIRELDDGRVMVKLNMSGVKILVTHPRGGSSVAGLDHFGIGTDDLRAAIDELKADGVDFTKDLAEPIPGFKMSFLQAPEAVSIELQEGGL